MTLQLSNPRTLPNTPLEAPSPPAREAPRRPPTEAPGVQDPVPANVPHETPPPKPEKIKLPD